MQLLVHALFLRLVRSIVASQNFKLVDYFLVLVLELIHFFRRLKQLLRQVLIYSFVLLVFSPHMLGAFMRRIFHLFDY